jgi:hypothetical protein
MAARRPPSAARRAMLAALACAFCLPAPADAAPVVTLNAGLHPEQLGASTTIKLALSIAFAPGERPAPLRVIELLLPAHLGVATSGLGLTPCRAALLEADGPPGCPSTSVLGYGSGLVEVPFGNGTVREEARLTTFLAPKHEGHQGLLFFADGEVPVVAELVFHGLVLHATAPFGGDLQTQIPLISAGPEGPDVILRKFSTTIGPEHITYWEYSSHGYIPYHPSGIQLPPQCPHAGFPFDAALTFENGTHAQAHAAVPCPHRPRPESHADDGRGRPRRPGTFP